MSNIVSSVRHFLFSLVFISFAISFPLRASPLSPQHPENAPFYALQSQLLDNSIYFNSFKGPGDIITVPFPRNFAFHTIAQDILVAPLSPHEKNILWTLFLLRSMEYPNVRNKEWSWQKTLRSYVLNKAAYHPAELLTNFRLTSSSAMQATQTAALTGGLIGLGASLGIPYWLEQKPSLKFSGGSAAIGVIGAVYIFWQYQAHMLQNFEFCVSTLFKTVKIYKKYLPVHLIESVENLHKQCLLLDYKTLTGIDYQKLQAHIEQVLIFYKDLCKKAGVLECPQCKHFTYAPPSVFSSSDTSAHTSTGYGSTTIR